MGMIQAHCIALHSLLQGIVPTQGSNPGLLHCRWILYHLSPGEAHCAFFWYYYYVSSTFRLSGFRSWRSGAPAVCVEAHSDPARRTLFTPVTWVGAPTGSSRARVSGSCAGPGLWSPGRWGCAVGRSMGLLPDSAAGAPAFLVCERRNSSTSR